MAADRRRALGVWLLLVIACAAIAARTNFRTDMGAFLPSAAPLATQVLTDQVSHGAASHLLLLGITGAPPPVLAALSARLAGRMRCQDDFTQVLNGDAASFADVQNFVWRNRYLLSPGVTADHFTVPGLHAALLNDVGLLGSDMGAAIQQSLPADPTGEILVLVRQFAPAGGPAKLGGVWVAADGTRALLLVYTRVAGFDIDAQQQALGLIDADFAQARDTVPGAAAARLIESGPGVFALHTRDITKRDVTRLSILATAGAAGLLAFAYRSPLLLLLGLLPVATGALAAVAAVSLAFGFVHGITIGFGATLIGESLDYAIYLFTQTGRGDTAATTLARIWPTLRLGAVTSVVGFGAMLFSNFTGFAQLGLFSIAGLITAAGVTRFVLPHLVPAAYFSPGAETLARPVLAAMRHRRVLRFLVPAAALAATLALLTHRGGWWDDNLADMSPIPVADQAADQMLRHDLGVPDLRYFAVFQAPSKQLALQQSEALAGTLGNLVARKWLGGFDVPSAILPSLQTQQQRQAALPDPANLAAGFAQAAAGLPFRAGTFAPFFAAAAGAKAAPPLTPASLPPALSLRLQSMLIFSHGGWVVVAPLHDVVDPAAIAATLAQTAPPGAALVDLNQQSAWLLADFQHEATLLALIGGAAILAVLLAGLAAPRRAVAVAAPLAAAVIVTAALLTANGARLTIFEVVGFLLIVAVGSNYCLFFERIEPDEGARRRAIASIVLANLCTVSAYGLMSASAIPVLHDIGRTVAIGTFLSLVFAATLSKQPLFEKSGAKTFANLDTGR